MINNKLTEEELKKIIVPIIRLEPIEKIKGAIYDVLHFTKALPTDKSQYIICSKTTGVISTYRGFEIEVRRLNDTETGYTGVIIHFKKRKPFFSFFQNPIRHVINDLCKLIDTEIHQARLKDFDPGGIVKEDVTERFLYQLGAFNLSWKEQDKLSPLSLYTRENFNSYFVEFLFTPNCYDRISNKTVLKDDWSEIFSLYTP